MHGCFWHGHGCARSGRAPKANAAFWRAKLERNRARDAEVAAALAGIGRSAAIVWECELRDAGRALASLARFLGRPR